MQSSLGVKNTYATIWTGAYLRTTSGTSTATRTLKLVDNLAGSSLPPPKEFLQAITTPQENSFSITTARKQTLTQIKGRATE
jgi:hypothetical protein